MRGSFLGLLLPGFASAAFDLAKLTYKNESVGIQYMYDGRRVSPWHDVPFEAGEDTAAFRGVTPMRTLLHFVCEIPRHTREKVEIHKTAPYNDLLQDVHKDGSLRTYVYSAAIINCTRFWALNAPLHSHTTSEGVYP